MKEREDRQDNILSALWHSDVHDIFVTELTNEFHAECRAETKLKEVLIQTMSPDQLTLFQEYIDQLTTVASIENEQSFRKGFKCGIRMIIEGLS